MVGYATARRIEGKVAAYKPGRIAEYNLLGSLFEEAFGSVQRTNAQFRELIDDSLQGVLVHANQKVLYANQALLEMLHYPIGSPEELKGESIWKIYAPHEHERLKTYHSPAQQGRGGSDRL